MEKYSIFYFGGSLLYLAITLGLYYTSLEKTQCPYCGVYSNKQPLHDLDTCRYCKKPYNFWSCTCNVTDSTQ